ncbi:MAG: hypothetical protein OES57_18005 [Acidimicrobiia bacterium]|nr:hypothetical protein [Acidimicrobiia bacterium]
MTTIESFGLAVELPAGWDGVIFRRDPDPAERAAGGVDNPVLHAANFSLPASRGDFGSGAVEIMGRGGVLVCLVEYNRESAGSALFAREGLPRSVDPDDFATHTLQRPQAGQGGLQVFFHEGDRAFCLYVVIGSHRRRRVLTPVVNELLRGLRVV